jgi:hypothetical protein
LDQALQDTRYRWKMGIEHGVRRWIRTDSIVVQEFSLPEAGVDEVLAYAVEHCVFFPSLIATEIRGQCRPYDKNKNAYARDNSG